MPRAPYTLAPTTNPRLLITRSREISLAVEAATADLPYRRHVLLIGDQRMGRTSTLDELARRLKEDHRILQVRLEITDQTLSTSGLLRAVLTATVEEIASLEQTTPHWYRAWCDRVYLRQRTPAGEADELVSALLLASDHASVMEPAVLRRDMRLLAQKAKQHGYEGILLLADDADALFEDDELTHRLITTLDNAGWVFAAASLPPSFTHLVESSLSCFPRLEVIPIAPFWSQGQIWNCLAAALDPAELKDIRPPRPNGLLLDLRTLTSGNPFLISLFAKGSRRSC